MHWLGNLRWYFLAFLFPIINCIRDNILEWQTCSTFQTWLDEDNPFIKVTLQHPGAMNDFKQGPHRDESGDEIWLVSRSGLPAFSSAVCLFSSYTSPFLQSPPKLHMAALTFGLSATLLLIFHPCFCCNLLETTPCVDPSLTTELSFQALFWVTVLYEDWLSTHWHLSNIAFVSFLQEDTTQLTLGWFFTRDWTTPSSYVSGP